MPKLIDSSALGARCRTAREWMGYTQDYAATKAIISRTQIVNVEAGRGLPSLQLLHDLCEIYNVSADWIIWGDR